MAKLKEGETYAIPNSDVYVLVYSCVKQKDGQFKVVGLTVDPDTLETMASLVMTLSPNEIVKYKKVKI